MEPESHSLLRIGVRALCAFGARSGDLDRRFHATPSAREGQDGHRVVASRRSAGYQSEVRLEASRLGLLVRGRADGFDPAASRLDEVKTFRGPFLGIKQNQRALHLAQLRTYGYMMCRKQGLDRIELNLCYFEIDSGREFNICVAASLEHLTQHFEALCASFQAWRKQEVEHRSTRRIGLDQVQFPYADFRVGQRQLAEAVYRTNMHDRTLLVEASTGMGKTVATIFPVLKAWPEKDFDKLFFLTARNTGRGPALAALSAILPKAVKPIVRVLELVARDQACEFPERECNGDSCPLAKGFYDRLPGARQDAISSGSWNQLAIRHVALQHQVCPYYLARELITWSDIVVGDYNHYFDRKAMLFGMTVENEWNISLLIDEGHNLLERGRAMYSVELKAADFQRAHLFLPGKFDELFDAVLSDWRKLAAPLPYRTLEQKPVRLLASLEQLTRAMGVMQSEALVPLPAEILDLYFKSLQFEDLAAQTGEHCFLEIATEFGTSCWSSALSVRNVFPAPYLRPRFESAAASVLFSATLAPFQFQRDVLGLPSSTMELSVSSPFQASQLAVRIAPVSMRFHQREDSTPQVVEMIAAEIRRRPGNYMVFTSSFEHLNQLAEALRRSCPDISIARQHAAMSAADRESFLAHFKLGARNIGFAVMGGIFGEGIDLPGEQLVGAFICTLGLGMFNERSSEMRRRMERAFGDGFAYQYLYPALQRVSQAAGRVIRTTTDRGTVYLIDGRFARNNVRALLPSWWKVEDAPMLLQRHGY